MIRRYLSSHTGERLFPIGSRQASKSGVETRKTHTQPFGQMVGLLINVFFNLKHMDRFLPFIYLDMFCRPAWCSAESPRTEENSIDSQNSGLLQWLGLPAASQLRCELQGPVLGHLFVLRTFVPSSRIQFVAELWDPKCKTKIIPRLKIDIL